MKHILSISGLLLVTALMLSGCKSSKTVQSGKMPDAVPAFDVNAYKNRVVARAARPSALTARLALTLKAGTKEISVNGSLRMQRDDVIQLSLTFLGMEVGRMEFTQQDVLLVDRFNKQYVRVPYGELDFLQRARLDFEALQALFWNELFVPGSSGKLSELMSRFKVSEHGDYVRFVLDDAPQLTYDFQTVRGNGLLDQTTISGKTSGDATKFVGRYGDFTDVSGYTFPTRIQFAVEGLRRGNYSLDMTLSRLSTSDKWEKRTEISSKYRQRTVNDIMRQLMSL